YDYTTRMYSVFAQDDWRVAPSIKLLYGLRYDKYTPPSGVGAAPIATSQSFPADNNNVQPRVGIVYTPGSDSRTVLRANTGLMYDQPINAMYEQAIVNDGTPLRANLSLSPTQPGAPSFPNVVSSGSGGANNPWTIDPAFRVGRMWQSNVQVERGLGADYAATAGFSYTRGSDLPLVSNVNLINPAGTLADGRPVYSTSINAATRIDPRYNAIFDVQSLGESSYRALTLQLTRRFSDGIQWA